MSALLITGLGALFKEHVLTPRGKDMNPVLGPVVAASPERKLSYRWVLSNVILTPVIEGQTVGCYPTRYAHYDAEWEPVGQLFYAH